jgi:hypothetical protein
MALSAFAWMLLMSGHEILGHGAACVGLGGTAISVDAMYFECSSLAPLWKDQLYRAGGSIFNVLLAAGAVLLLKRLAAPSGWLGYFLWISAILNLLQSGSYVAFGRFIHPGMDWAMIVANASSSSTWAIAVTIVGVGLLVAGILVGRAWLPLFLSPEAPLGRQSSRLLITPYLTAGAVSIAASAFVPSPDRLMMIMGGIGNSLFFLAPILLLLIRSPRLDKMPAEGPNFGPRPGIVLAGVVVTLLYIFVLARGVTIG